MKIQVYTCTEQGPRSCQQDRFLVKGNLLVIADGMGGHAHGDLAAEACVEAFDDLETYTRQDLFQAIQAADKACKDADNILRGGPPRMSDLRDGRGSTCTAVILTDGECPWIHVGDTRMGFVTPEQHGPLTKDQGSGHVLWNTVGALNTKETCAGTFGGLKVGDAIVLTTDGVHDYLAAKGQSLMYQIIRKSIKRGLDPAEAIVTKALETSNDNCTAIVAVVKELA